MSGPTPIQASHATLAALYEGRTIPQPPPAENLITEHNRRAQELRDAMDRYSDRKKRLVPHARMRFERDVVDILGYVRAIEWLDGVE